MAEQNESTADVQYPHRRPLDFVNSTHNTPKKLLFAIALAHVRRAEFVRNRRGAVQAGSEKQNQEIFKIKIRHCQYLISQYAELDESAEMSNVTNKCRERLLWQIQESFGGVVFASAGIQSNCIESLHNVVSNIVQIASKFHTERAYPLDTEIGLRAAKFEREIFRLIELFLTKLTQQILQTQDDDGFFVIVPSCGNEVNLRVKTFCVSFLHPSQLSLQCSTQVLDLTTFVHFF